jgi:hypothetical protein
MHELFRRWYISFGPIIKRSKIELNDNRFNKGNTQNFTKRKSGSFNINYEIEIYPIFTKFYMLDDILNYSASDNIDSIKDYLINNLSENNNSQTKRLYPFSRLTKFKEIQKTLEISKKMDNGKIRLWILYQNKFYLVNNEKSLEEENINDSLIVICEVINNGNWPTNNLAIFKEYNQSNTKIKKTVTSPSKIFVGLMNIGNSK